MILDNTSSAASSVSTSLSLLARAQARDEDAWGKLAYLYGPMVYRWTRKAGLQPDDAKDVVQNVFLSVASDIDRFRRNRPGDSFRGWLWTICRHKILDFFRDRQNLPHVAGGTTAQLRMQQVAEPEPTPPDDQDEMCRLRHRALALLRGQFERHIWEAFLRTAIHGDRPLDVAKDLGISVATVYRAKFRVLSQLRGELEES